MQNSDEQEPNETVSTMIGMTRIYASSLLGLSSCHSSTVWANYASHPRLAKRFASSMKALTSNTGQSPFHLATGYSWSELPPSSTVVDIGGSEGHVSAVIAQRHPYLNFVV